MLFFCIIRLICLSFDSLNNNNNNNNNNNIIIITITIIKTVKTQTHQADNASTNVSEKPNVANRVKTALNINIMHQCSCRGVMARFVIGKDRSLVTY